jgi:hypothetical protein
MKKISVPPTVESMQQSPTKLCQQDESSKKIPAAFYQSLTMAQGSIFDTGVLNGTGNAALTICPAR